MKVNLWYCKNMKLWRWTATEDSLPVIRQETGQNKSFEEATKEISKVIRDLEDKN